MENILFPSKWFQEWKIILEKLQTMRPILALLNSQEIALFEKYYKYLEINIDKLENIKTDVHTIITLRERLELPELSTAWPKLEQPSFPEVSNLIKTAPKNQITISIDKDMPGIYIVHLRELTNQVPTWQGEFNRVVGR